MEANPLGWFQMGANIVARGQDQRLQRQQLKAQESDRAIRERMLAAQIAQTELENQKLQEDIAKRAQEDAQWLQVNTDIAKRKLVFDNALEMATSGGFIKDPAAIQAPDWQGMRKQAAFELAQQGNSRAQEVVKSELAAESAMALARQREASTKLAEARTTALADPTRGSSGTLPELEKIFKAAESEGAPFSPKAKQLAREIHLGLQSKPGSQEQVMSEAAYVAKNLPDFIQTARKQVEEPASFGRTVKKSVRMSEDEAINALRLQYKAIFQPAAQSASAPPAALDEAAVETLRTQIRADFKSGKLTREQALEALRKTGMK